MKDLLFVISIFLIVAILLAITPVAFIWGVNTLFGQSIPYDLKSIFAAWVLLFVVRIVTRTEVEKLKK
jgi:hypothetical protein